MDLNRGGIYLNDTSVGLQLKAGAARESPPVHDLETRCWYLNGEKLSCQGNVDLAGIRVAKKGALDGSVSSGETLNTELLPNDDTREDPISQVKRREIGYVSLRGAQIAGDLLLAFTNEQNADSPEATNASMRALIQNALDLTAVHCEKLVFSGEIFEGGSKLPTILARGHFSRLEILEWNDRPLDLRQVTVDGWGFGADPKQTGRQVEKYIQMFQRMEPEDQSTRLSVEAELRNKSYEREANKFYLEVERSLIDRRWKQRTYKHRNCKAAEEWLLLRLQKCFLFAKANFIPLLLLTGITMFGLSLLFRDPANVRATVGYLHALPATTRTAVDDQNEIDPNDLHEKWTKWDAMALALRYHVPLFESRTHDRWEASGSDAKIGTYYLPARMETIAFIIEVFYWIALPILLLGFAAWAFRKREAE
jgi:hypothetical protein